MTADAAPSFLVRTKLHRPRISGDLVARPRLHEQLNRTLDQPLAFVCAPAGFGKTTLLVDWLDTHPWPSAWLSLDERDDAPEIFLQYFIAAIRTVFPRVGANTLALLQMPNAPSVLQMAAALADDLGELQRDALLPPGQRLIMVLDDFHLMRSQAVPELLAALLANSAHVLHLILSTRETPALPHPAGMAGSSHGEIRADGLRFTLEESVAFLQRAVPFPLDPATMAALSRSTGGWAAGLRLSAVALDAGGEAGRHVAAPSLGSRYLMDYLINEVLAQVPLATTEFLLKTSILERLSGPLCNAVTGAAASQETLEWLAQANLFTESLDAEQGWYRYHDLFRQILRRQLERQSSAPEIAALHLRASAWYANRGFPNEALSHALSANEPVAAAQVVEAFRYPALNQEQWVQLEQWLRQMPRWLIDERPGLLMLECWIMHRQFRLSEIPNRLDRIEAMLKQAPLPEPSGQHLQSEIDVLRSRLYFWAADAERMQEYAQRALSRAPLAYAYVRANAWTQVAGALQMKGDSEGAIAVVQQGLAEDRLYPHSFRTLLLITLCYSQWCSADLSGLIATGQQVISLGGREGLTDSMARAHHYLGCAYYQRNDLQAAAREFEIVLKRPYGVHALVVAQSGFGLAAAYQAAGESERANAVVEKGTAHALRLGNPAMLALNRAFGAHLALLQGRKAEAVHWAAQVQRAQPPAAMPAFFVPEIALAEALLTQGTPTSLDEAGGLLARLHDSVTAANNTRFLIDVLALQALLWHARRDDQEALATLERAVVLAQPRGVLRAFVDLGPAMASLLDKLSTRSAVPGFVARILHAFPATPQAEASLPVGGPASPGFDGAGPFEPKGFPTAASDTRPVMIEPLTKREREVLELLVRRLSAKEIGQQLAISDRTVRRHAANVYQKLGVDNRRDATAVARSLGILPPLC